MNTHIMAGHGIGASVHAMGAELCSFRESGGRELLWQAHEAWPRHAPILFPIVGTLKNNTLHVDGKSYPMGRHGFAREQDFAWAERTATSCRLVLTDSAATRAQYPFAFRFEVQYAIGADGLSIIYTIVNTGDVILPASMGAHPAFNWPLLPGLSKEAHTLTFSHPEPAPIRRVSPDGLLRPEHLPTPIEGNTLKLHDGLFTADAVILDRLASQSVRYTAPGAPVIEVSWQGLPELGIWTRPGVDLLCIEPWHGMSDPADFDGDFHAKPGLHLIPPGETRSALHRIAIV
jgi:galactose mutarotase-like enzyme